MDMTNNTRGGLSGPPPSLTPPKQIYLLQRKKGVLGKGLGKTTGWIVRAEVRGGEGEGERGRGEREGGRERGEREGGGEGEGGRNKFIFYKERRGF